MRRRVCVSLILGCACVYVCAYVVQGNIANILYAQKKLPEALAMLHEVLAVRSATLGSEHRDTIAARKTYTSIHVHLFVRGMDLPSVAASRVFVFLKLGIRNLSSTTVSAS